MEILKKIEQLKAELDSLQPVNEDVEARIWQKFRLDWNYHSNKLEGNTYSFGETKMLLLKGLTAGGKPVRDHQEISGHDEAISFIIESIREKEELTEVFIRHLHKMILVRQFWADAKTPDGQPTKRLIKVGEYKTEPNHVETQTGAIFYFAEPIETPAKMQEMVEWFRVKSESPETNAILLAAEFHYKFVRIHPFDDGNGRLARLLMNYILMKYGFPPVIIRNEDKDNYIAVLEQADFSILEPFIEYIATNLERSLEIMIKGAGGEDIEEPEDLDKELALLERKLKDETGERLSKTAPIVLEILEEMVFPFISKFVATCKKFNRFYVKNKALILYDMKGYELPTDEHLISSLRAHIANRDLSNLDSFEIEYVQEEFSNSNFDSFDFRSSVSVKFKEFVYVVNVRGGSWDSSTNIEKRYVERISDEELNKAISRFARAHKRYIDEKTAATN